ncbi:hypothetical protein M0802_002243 [Mischocyttarus mexicanus]|nr:hypothetical protein M0802_002243 [Mischocyttarus mexicanus]
MDEKVRRGRGLRRVSHYDTHDHAKTKEEKEEVKEAKKTSRSLRDSLEFNWRRSHRSNEIVAHVLPTNE